MKLTAGQAAKQTGKSVPTIVRAFKNGRISGEKTEGGGYLFDASELFRVFPPVTRHSDDETQSLEHETPFEASPLQVEIRMLRERLVEVTADKDSVIEDLRKRLDAEAEERRRLTMLLTDQRPPLAPASPAVAEQPKRRWWHFGKANS